MKLKGKCKALCIYVDENLKWKGGLLYKALVDQLLKAGMAGTTVFKGVEGYGASAHLHTARILEVTENLPVMVETIDKPAKVQKALKLLKPMLPNHCLVTLQDVQVLNGD